MVAGLVVPLLAHQEGGGGVLHVLRDGVDRHEQYAPHTEPTSRDHFHLLPEVTFLAHEDFSTVFD